MGGAEGVMKSSKTRSPWWEYGWPRGPRACRGGTAPSWRCAWRSNHRRRRLGAFLERLAIFIMRVFVSAPWQLRCKLWTVALEGSDKSLWLGLRDAECTAMNRRAGVDEHICLVKHCYSYSRSTSSSHRERNQNHWTLGRLLGAVVENLRGV